MPPILIETAVVSAIAVGVAGLLAPSGLGLTSLYPHPVWLAVLIVAARYGGRGLTLAVPLAWGALALAAAGLRVSPGAVMQRLSSGADLGALVAAVLVSWIGSGHERRQAAVAWELASVRKRGEADQRALSELRRTALSLRARADRLDTSLTFLRDVSARLGGDDADRAAQAALDLVMARLGARAAVVEMLGKDGLSPLASAGVWAPGGTSSEAGEAPPGAAGDRTVAAAMRARQAIRAVDLQDGGPADSDLAAPIIDPRGELVGVLAVRGVPQGGVSPGALRDVAIIAAWMAAAVSGARAGRHAGAQVAVALALDLEGDAGSEGPDALERAEPLLVSTEPH
jgi:polysaccharide biosynthesis protein PelD